MNTDDGKLKDNQAKVCRGSCRKEGSTTKFSCKCQNCICYVCDDDSYSDKRMQQNAPPVDTNLLIRTSKKTCRGPCSLEEHIGIDLGKNEKDSYDSISENTFSESKFTCKCVECICYVCDDEKYKDKQIQNFAPQIDNEALKNEKNKVSESYSQDIDKVDKESVAITDTLQVDAKPKKVCRGACSKKELPKFSCICEDCICYVCDGDQFKDKLQQQMAPAVDCIALTLEKIGESEQDEIADDDSDVIIDLSELEEVSKENEESINTIPDESKPKICHGPCAKKETVARFALPSASKEKLDLHKNIIESMKFYCKCEECSCYVCDDEKYSDRLQQQSAPPAILKSKKKCTCKKNYCGKCGRGGKDMKKKEKINASDTENLISIKEECPVMSICAKENESPENKQRICRGPCANENDRMPSDTTHEKFSCKCQDCMCYVCDDEEHARLEQKKAPPKKPCICKKNICGKCYRSTKFSCKCKKCICYVCEDPKHESKQQENAPPAYLEILEKEIIRAKKTEGLDFIGSNEDHKETENKSSEDRSKVQDRYQVENKPIENVDIKDEESCPVLPVCFGKKDHLDEPCLEPCAREQINVDTLNQPPAAAPTEYQQVNVDTLNQPTESVPTEYQQIIVDSLNQPPESARAEYQQVNVDTLNQRPESSPTEYQQINVDTLNQPTESAPTEYQQVNVDTLNQPPEYVSADYQPINVDTLNQPESAPAEYQQINVDYLNQPPEAAPTEYLITDDEKIEEKESALPPKKKPCKCKKNYCGKCPRGFACKCKHCICYVCDDPRFAKRNQENAPPVDLDLLQKEKECPVKSVCAEEYTDSKPINDVTAEENTIDKSKICRGACAKKD